MPYMYPTLRSKRYSKVTAIGKPANPLIQRIMISTATATTPQTPLGRGDGLSDLNALSRTVISALLKAGMSYTVTNEGVIRGTGSKAQPVYFDMTPILEEYGVVGGSVITALIDPLYPVGGASMALGDPFNRRLPFTSVNGLVSLSRDVLLYANGVNYTIAASVFDLDPNKDYYCYIEILSDAEVSFVFKEEPIRENRYVIFVGFLPNLTTWVGTEPNRLYLLNTMVAWSGYKLITGTEKRANPPGSSLLAVNRPWSAK